MKLDRVLQKEILHAISGGYSTLPMQMPLDGMSEEEKDRHITNLLYLEAHGLIQAGLTQFHDGTWASDATPKITHKGLDFLADDGGLSAILDVVTIKIHDDTIRSLIEARIQAADLPPEEKTGLLNQLRELRGESIKHLTMKLLDVGVESLPTLLRLIQTSA